MANYFTYFPLTKYLANIDSKSTDDVTNITTRFNFQESLKENTAIYYEYDIQDSDTPEIIASKLYGSAERHWIILMFNDIIDPQWDWPLDQRTIIRYIDEKYTPNADTANGQTGIVWSQANNKEYLKIITRTEAQSGESISETIYVDANTYINVSVTSSNVALNTGQTIVESITKQAKSYYDWEIEQNENKRTIKLLRPEFVKRFETEVRLFTE